MILAGYLASWRMTLFHWRTTLMYMSVVDVKLMIQHYVHGTLLSKLDLADAFHHILIRPDHQW